MERFFKSWFLRYLMICLVVVGALCNFAGINVYAAAPADENYDDDADQERTSEDSFTWDDITYSLTGWSDDTFITNDSTSPLGDDGTDYYIAFKADSVTISASDSSNFKLNSFSMDVLADKDVLITPDGGAAVTGTYDYSSWITVTVDVSSNSDFENISSFTISGTNMLLNLDDLDFSAAVVPTYNVTYDANTSDSGSVPIDNNDYSNGDMVTVLGNTGSLARTGYTFAGWNTASDGSGTSYSASDTFSMGTSNVTLYAEWVHNVTYDSNSADSGSVPTDNNDYSNGDMVTVLGNIGSLARTGYTFAGWNTASDGSGTSYSASNTFSMGTSNVILYAQWSDAVPNTYRIVESGSNYEVWTGLSDGTRQGSYTTLADAIASVSGTNLVIQFGDGITPLSVPTTATYVNTLPAATYTGKVVSSGNEQYLFVVKDGVEVSFNDIEITNTSTYSSFGHNSRIVHVTNADAILNINGPDTIINSTNGSWCIYNNYNSGGTVNINDGTLTSGTEYSYSIYNHSGTVNIKGGTVKAEGSAAAIMSYDTINMTGGTVETTGSGIAIMAYGGTTNISGGYVTTLNSRTIFQPSGIVNISGTATILSTSSNTIDHSGGILNITGGTVQSTDTSTISQGSGTLNINKDATILSKSERAIRILSTQPDDTTSVVIDGVTVWNKMDAGISIYGAKNSSTGFYEISNESPEFGVDHANINVWYIKSPYEFGKWATTAARDVEVPNSTRNMKIGSNDTFYLEIFIPVSYKVEHYQEELDGSYRLVDTDNLTGEPNTTATASAKAYTGFSENTAHVDRVATGTITGDGSFVLKLYYDRDVYTVTFKDHDDRVIDTQYIKYEGDATAPTDPTRVGYTFTDWDKTFTDIAADAVVKATYSINSYNLTVNYTMADGSTAPASHSETVKYNEDYSVSSPAVNGYTVDPAKATVLGTMGASDVVVEVTYSANTDTAYKVEHYQEKFDGSYTLVDTDNLTGTTNTTATASAKTYTGFSENTAHVDRVATGTIAGDGSFVLKLYYGRDVYTVTFKDHDDTVIDNQSIKYQGNATAPTDPTRVGYTFGGWYKESRLTNLWDFAADTVTEATTLYAKWAVRSSGSSSSNTTSQTNQDTVIVIVNGEEQDGGKETKTTEAGKSTLTVEVDNKIVKSKIDEAIKNSITGTGNVIQVSIADTTAEVAKVELTGDIVKKLEENTFNVSVKRDDVEYVIPAEEFIISNVAQNLGVAETDLKDIKVDVKITKLDETVVEKYNEVAKANDAELVFPPVSFEIVAKTTKADDTTGKVEISKFSDYVERVMEIPAGVDSSKITTGIVFNPNGTYSHVPTEVFQKDGKWYVRINSLTNSEYSVIANSVTVKSVENHWSKDTVNDMASRLVIFNPENFEPNKAITRADFAEYIVRALGLYREGSTYMNKFKDVSSDGERTLAILIANEYGIVAGYPDGTFRLDALITREEAMTMYQKAMKVTKLTGSDMKRYQSYTDFAEVSSWAETYVKEVLAAHVFNGTSVTTISPKSKLTYAEAAQAIKNLLVESILINK